MNDVGARSERDLFSRWVLATGLGWLLGFLLVLALAVLWNLFGEGAQFMVGLGIGAGVGYTQSRVLKRVVPQPRRWLESSLLGMAFPFLLWDLSTLLEIPFPWSLSPVVLLGSLLTGFLQWRVLWPVSPRAAFWVVASVVGWGLPIFLLWLADLGLVPIPYAAILPIAVFLFGGLLLGAVSGWFLRWILAAEGGS